MRLTVDVISGAPQSIGPTKDRIISLRASKIPVIENLGVTQDHFDCIDLCDNDLIKISNIPLLKRLKTLLLANNRIVRIADDAFDCLPNLSSLVLTNNSIERLSDLEALRKATKLERLALVGNPLAGRPYYRQYVISLVPKLRYLDFERIQSKEREQAKELFSGEAGAKLLAEIAPPRQVTRDSAIERTQGERTNPSAEDIEKIKTAIAQATTLEEVTRLEKALKAGLLSDDVLDSAMLDHEAETNDMQVD